MAATVWGFWEKGEVMAATLLPRSLEFDLDLREVFGFVSPSGHAVNVRQEQPKERVS